jgi:hypothetical protein
MEKLVFLSLARINFVREIKNPERFALPSDLFRV